ncbi:polyprenyl synthetase family protein [Candidatus Collierbacteria bacterium]|nr:polyprenyl synthetase family protein [Candidatus Collierbacteria bacterium]
MDIKQTLIGFKEEFDAELLNFIKNKQAEANKLDKRYQVFIDLLEDYIIRGGKRLRPAFMYFGYISCGGKERKKIIKAARCVELLQAFLLMHDDIIDKSNLRRGRPTIHRMFESEHQELKLKGDREHFGRSTAMILGDLTHAFAYETLMESGFEDLLLVRARRLFDNLMFETAYGWYVELLGTNGSKAGEREIKRTMEYVSARYTIAGPLKLGATLAGAEKKVLKSLDKFGVKLGTAFQMQDDILGMFGSEEKVGKPVDSDFREGKKTLLLIQTLAKMKAKKLYGEIDRVLKIYGCNEATLDDYLWFRGRMLDLGVLDNIKKEALSLAGQARDELSGLRLAREGKVFLEEVAWYMVEREV